MVDVTVLHRIHQMQGDVVYEGDIGTWCHTGHDIDL